MISKSNNTQKKEIDILSNEFDKLLSDKYILAKEIRDLNKSIQDSQNIMIELEVELKDKSQLKELLEQVINQVYENKNEPCLPASKYIALNIIIEKYNSDPALQKLQKSLQTDQFEFIEGNQLIKEITLALTDEVRILHEKTEAITNAITDVEVEKETLKMHLKNIEDEIASLKSRVE